MPLRKLYLELTSRCNLDCSMCYRRTWSDGEADMAPELYESIKSEVLGPDGPGTVVLGGIGEPSVSPLFMDALDAFGGRPGRELIATSNGAGFGDSLVEAVARGAVRLQRRRAVRAVTGKRRGRGGRRRAGRRLARQARRTVAPAAADA